LSRFSPSLPSITISESFTPEALRENIHAKTVNAIKAAKTRVSASTFNAMGLHQHYYVVVL